MNGWFSSSAGDSVDQVKMRKYITPLAGNHHHSVVARSGTGYIIWESHCKMKAHGVFFVRKTYSGCSPMKLALARRQGQIKVMVAAGAAPEHR